LLSFQFLSPALTQAESKNYFATYQQIIQGLQNRSFSWDFLFEENKTEREGEDENEDERLLHCFEIADLSFVSNLLVKIHTPFASLIPIEQQYDLQPPLFKVHCIYLI
jgi:hypothetical protein